MTECGTVMECWWLVMGDKELNWSQLTYVAATILNNCGNGSIELCRATVL